MKKIILLLILFLTTACARHLDQGSILEKSSCKLPCWNEILAGQTTENELLQILAHLSDIDQNSIKNTNQAWNIFDNQVFFSFSKQTKLRGYTYITNGTVSELTICGITNVSIGDIVAEAGEPESVFSAENLDGNRTIILTDSQKGISYWYSTGIESGGGQYVISPDTRVECITLFDPNLYEKMLDAKRFSNGHYNAEETLKVTYPWDGYGNLSEKYPPRRP